MKRRSFLKGLLGLAVLPIAAKANIGGGSSNVGDGGSEGIKPRKGVDYPKFSRQSVAYSPMTATEVLDRREEWAEAAGQRMSEIFSREFEKRITQCQ